VDATNQTPTFNLKAVIRETGLKPDTLRAWERRYGLPKPQRTAGGHRLYSQRDIDTLKWLVARQGEGLSISRAVDLWRKLETDGQDPLTLPGYATPERTTTPVIVPQGHAVADLREAWLSACLAFDEQGAAQILTQAFALYPPESVCFELLQKGLVQVGEDWYRGAASVQQEHFASALAMRRLQALVASAPPPTRPGRLLVGCAPEEAHAFGALLLTYLLKRRGWQVVYLGTRVPAMRMEETVNAIQPRLVILSAQQLHTAATLLEVARLLQAENVPLAFGGLIFDRLPALRQRIPGHFLGQHIAAAPQVVEQLMASSRPAPPVEALSETYQQALDHYRDRQVLLEAEVWQRIELKDVFRVHLPFINVQMARHITAALALGDVGFLNADVDWIEGLAAHRGIAADTLRHYWDVYHQAAMVHLDERGRLVVDWLAELASPEN
jgi:DNA-binding transcriptional MerR regulator/methylmalonyl-CoA mutase cobalamin-binding subunit